MVFISVICWEIVSSRPLIVSRRETPSRSISTCIMSCWLDSICTMRWITQGKSVAILMGDGAGSWVGSWVTSSVFGDCHSFLMCGNSNMITMKNAIRLVGGIEGHLLIVSQTLSMSSFTAGSPT